MIIPYLQLSYRYLVVSLGLQLNYDRVRQSVVSYVVVLVVCIVVVVNFISEGLYVI